MGAAAVAEAALPGEAGATSVNTGLIAVCDVVGAGRTFQDAGHGHATCMACAAGTVPCCVLTGGTGHASQILLSAAHWTASVNAELALILDAVAARDARSVFAAGARYAVSVGNAGLSRIATFGTRAAAVNSDLTRVE